MREGFEDLHDYAFVRALHAHMNAGIKQRWIHPQFWFDHGLDDKPNPIQVRKCSAHSEPEWTVKARVSLGGKNVRVLKSMLKVHDEFAALYAQEVERRRLLLEDSPWMKWDPNVLWSRLVAAADESDTANRTELLPPAKKHTQLAKLAIEWGLPVVTQSEWLASQRRAPDPKQRLQFKHVKPPAVFQRQGPPAGAPPIVEHGATGMLVPDYQAASLGTDYPHWQRFYRAACEGDSAAIPALLQDKKGVVKLFGSDHPDIHGRTVLHRACANGDLPTVRLLVTERSNLEFKMTGARVCRWLEDVDENGWTPFFFACWWGNHLAAEFLIRNDIFVQHTNHAGLTAIELALRAGNRHQLIAYLASTGLIDDDPWIEQFNIDRLASHQGGAAQQRDPDLPNQSTHGPYSMLPRIHPG